jgi:dTDP-4-amino-4,6-dideoxygalactose transaminase
MEKFTGSFTQQEPIPDEGIAAAVEVMRHGRLHRYNLAGDEAGEVALLEQDFAAHVGARFCLAVASGGAAMTTALRAAGVGPGDPVLSNAFTLAPVPGAIHAVGARAVFVEVTGDLTLDLDDLAVKAAQSGARVLLLSHMRGHICDMGRLMGWANAAGVLVIEDCAHTMGAAWDGVPSGRHGLAGCYSTQTYKHLNSGEGGLIVSDDAEFMARAVLISGSYMHYGRHLAGPEAAAYAQARYDMPNVSGRMDNLRAAILRPQLRQLADRVARWERLYRAVEDGLSGVAGLSLIPRPARERFVGSSFQFLLPDWDRPAIEALVTRCKARGVDLKWFGAAEPVAFTSRYDHWRFAAPPRLPRTDAVLAGLIDMRLPLTFTPGDCVLIARIIRAEAGAIWQGMAAEQAPCAPPA